MLNNFRVLYVLNSSSKHGGSSKSFLNMLDGLIGKDITPFVVMPNYGGLCEELSQRDIQFLLMPYVYSIYPPFKTNKNKVIFLARLLRTLYINAKATKQLINYIQEITPHIIHSNVGPIYIGYMAAKKLKIPHVWHIREYQTLDFEMHPLFSMNGFIQKLHTFNNYPIAITRGIYNYFSMDDSASVINNAICKTNCTQFITRKKNYFLFAGRLEKNKGINNLIIAFIDFAKKNPDYLLYIAGETTDLNNERILLSLIENAGINERVMFLGMRDDINSLMSQATALIVPSIHEGFGRITVEAMFNGCLVIGNNSAGTKEILEPENLGILYSKHDELVAAMQTVIEKGIESYFPMLIKAQERAVTLYSQEQNIDAIYKLYNRITDAQTKTIL
ncbi:glycosyltransferase family 4 protein [Methylobacter sp. S3L5C]|uniref:glycosyltransferase family 4 protein n=1 Tax=Methylobacter sp. S3L5C TaxID=2839024 RepID=UPI001FAC0C7A|nr:glycosyltransferase family 4 protein [Methylobacter sp. S3L5C]UOA08277.1 glycosyltransferase family 4 protein [Methylobacter sp. S3L5C]